MLKKAKYMEGQTEKQRKSSQARIDATARFKKKCVRRQVDFSEKDRAAFEFADSECRKQGIGFQRYVINLIREKMNTTADE